MVTLLLLLTFTDPQDFNLLETPKYTRAKCECEDCDCVKCKCKEERRRRILYFTVPWCLPCKKMQANFFKRLTDKEWQIDDTKHAHIQTINGDENPNLLIDYKVELYPTFIIIQDGKIIGRHSGVPTYEQFLKFAYTGIKTK